MVEPQKVSGRAGVVHHDGNILDVGACNLSGIFVMALATSSSNSSTGIVTIGKSMPKPCSLRVSGNRRSSVANSGTDRRARPARGSSRAQVERPLHRRPRDGLPGGVVVALGDVDTATMRRRVRELGSGGWPRSAPTAGLTSFPAASLLTARSSIRPSMPSRKRRWRCAGSKTLRFTSVASLLIDHYDEDWSTLGGCVLTGRPGDRVGGHRSGAGASPIQVRPVDDPPPVPVIAMDITAWSHGLEVQANHSALRHGQLGGADTLVGHGGRLELVVLSRRTDVEGHLGR